VGELCVTGSVIFRYRNDLPTLATFPDARATRPRLHSLDNALETDTLVTLFFGSPKCACP
jgi:hypothetical protein